jgi:hypothetical protein
MRIWSIGLSFTWTGQGSDPGLRDDMSATNFVPVNNAMAYGCQFCLKLSAMQFCTIQYFTDPKHLNWIPGVRTIKDLRHKSQITAQHLGDNMGTYGV